MNRIDQIKPNVKAFRRYAVSKGIGQFELELALNVLDWRNGKRSNSDVFARLAYNECIRRHRMKSHNPSLATNLLGCKCSCSYTASDLWSDAIDLTRLEGKCEGCGFEYEGRSL